MILIKDDIEKDSIVLYIYKNTHTALDQLWISSASALDQLWISSASALDQLRISYIYIYMLYIYVIISYILLVNNCILYKQQHSNNHNSSIGEIKK